MEYMTNEKESESKEALAKNVHFYGFLDRHGRIIIPTRNRKEAGLMDMEADVECSVSILKIYKEETAKQ